MNTSCEKDRLDSGLDPQLSACNTAAVSLLCSHSTQVLMDYYGILNISD